MGSQTGPSEGLDPAAGARALETLNANIADWEQRRDAEAVRALDLCLSSAVVFRRADGSVVGKRAFMDALDSPSPFAERSTRDIQVAIVGDRALVTATVSAQRLGETTARRYRNVRVFFRSDQRWTLEVWFNDETTNLAG